MQFCDFIANISGLDRKTALQPAITPVAAYQIWRTFNFGPQTAKNLVLFGPQMTKIGP